MARDTLGNGEGGMQVLVAEVLPARTARGSGAGQ